LPRWNRVLDAQGRLGARAGSSSSDEAVTRTRPRTGRRLAHVNSSSNALASFRSAVSKPSVNQP
jgi:hypothetical protein